MVDDADHVGGVEEVRQLKADDAREDLLGKEVEIAEGIIGEGEEERDTRESGRVSRSERSCSEAALLSPLSSKEVRDLKRERSVGHP